MGMMFGISLLAYAWLESNVWTAAEPKDTWLSLVTGMVLAGTAGWMCGGWTTNPIIRLATYPAVSIDNDLWDSRPKPSPTAAFASRSKTSGR